MDNFNQLWDLYQRSFPEVERRTIDQQKQVMGEENYHMEYFFEDSDFTGFILYWVLPSFLFIEHVAVDDRFRGRGLGKKYLEKMIKDSDVPIILEVEPPENEMAKRRIKFYERLGFVLNQYEYYQPSYVKDGEPIRLIVMSHGSALSKEDFEGIKLSLYRQVYKVNP